MIALDPSEVEWAPSSLVDDAGQVFVHGGRVFRAIREPVVAERCRDLLRAPAVDALFEAGLVRTWVAGDVALGGFALVLEHERVPFAVHPAEHTSRMLWESAHLLLGVASAAHRLGTFPKDAHPWNVLFHRGRPCFVDFGSLLGVGGVPPGWFEEFRRYYGVPIFLAARGWDGLAREYRRQHGNGFGLRLFEAFGPRELLLRGLSRLARHRQDPQRLCQGMGAWLEEHRPRPPQPGTWDEYEQAVTTTSGSPSAQQKEHFVRQVLEAGRPASVLDCAANKGLYSALAARLGSAVVAFDQEEGCVDRCLDLARAEGLDITPALMDFRQPTPASGWGLAYPDAFERFRSDLVLALGLCHHLCISQGVPVRLFCEICARFATRGVVLEYVDPADRHVAAWNRPVPADYSLEGFTAHLARRFPHRTLGEPITTDGLRRRMAWFRA